IAAPPQQKDLRDLDKAEAQEKEEEPVREDGADDACRPEKRRESQRGPPADTSADDMVLGNSHGENRQDRDQHDHVARIQLETRTGEVGKGGRISSPAKTRGDKSK